MNRIRLLDCTLRDGGHLNGGQFGEHVIRYVIRKLADAGVDIIEAGFLWEKYCGSDSARYLRIADIKKLLPEHMGNSKISLMADYIDLDGLEPYDGTVEYIRLSFKRNRLGWAMETMKKLQEKGYRCFMNPVNCNVYSDKEYIEIIEQINRCRPYGFSMVDTFGTMRINDLSARYYLVENNLSKDIVLGLHLHENLGLAYSLAQHFLEIRTPLRDIVIDCSLLGMGRAPGNLCSEQIMEHLNSCYGAEYGLESAYDAIDDYIIPARRKIPWGYSIPYALSAQNRLHRTYAEYLMNKWKLKTSDIQNILRQVDKAEAETFHESYIEGLYRKYMDVEVADGKELEELKKRWEKKTVLIVAPGASVLQKKEELQELAAGGERVVVSVNFIPDFLCADFVFFTNVKRYETEVMKRKREEIIVTSNLQKSASKNSRMVRYGRLAYHGGEFNDDSVLMLLHLLKDIGIGTVETAGFDGFMDGRKNFYRAGLDRELNGEYKNLGVKNILAGYYKEMKIRFLTPSCYEEGAGTE